MLYCNYIKILTNSIKKKIQLIFKSLGYSLFFLLYGRIRGVIKLTQENEWIKTTKFFLDKNTSYKIYNIKNCRIYTDTVSDTAYIIDGKIVEGPSYQLRNVKNSDIKNNIVFNKGTPNIKRKYKGTIFSLLTGGAAKFNYWHWMFDILPKLTMLKESFSFTEIDYFLFPNIHQKFQIETLDLLDIPINKRLSGVKNRHIEADKIITVDHPYVINNDPSLEIQNLPQWIINSHRKNFLLKKKNNVNLPKKIFIDRSDSRYNHHIHSRRIANEDGVKKILTKNGFSIITLSNLKFSDQVSLFNNASHIVGLHGAGFANIVFCEPKTKVVELKSIYAGEVIGNLAKKLQLNYIDISVTPRDRLIRDQQGLIDIPLDSLERSIS